MTLEEFEKKVEALLVKDEASLVGKTIKDTQIGNGEIYLAFEDGTAMCLQANHGYDDSLSMEIAKGFTDISIYSLVDVGLFTDEERQEYQRLQEKMWSERQQKREKEQWERLKAKYGG